MHSVAKTGIIINNTVNFITHVKGYTYLQEATCKLYFKCAMALAIEFPNGSVWVFPLHFLIHHHLSFLFNYIWYINMGWTYSKPYLCCGNHQNEQKCEEK